MRRQMPAACPVCSGPYEITRCTCTQCGSELSGHFTGCDFCGLTDDEARFVLTFLKCRGSIKEVEKELDISYPTVRSKLDDVIASLGYKVMANEKSDINRKEILDMLSKGEITYDEAVKLLKEGDR